MAGPTVVAEETQLTIRRTLAAPLPAVWALWTRPSEVARWCRAVPGSVRLDLRPGGAWQATVSRPRGPVALCGVFLDVVPLERLVWVQDRPGEPLVTTVEFGEHSGASLTETVVAFTQDVVDEVGCDDVRAAVSAVLDDFADHLARAGVR